MRGRRVTLTYLSLALVQFVLWRPWLHSQQPVQKVSDTSTSAHNADPVAPLLVREPEPAASAAGARAGGMTSVPASLFDVVGSPFGTVVTSIEVHGIEHELDMSAPQPYLAGGDDVLTSAGTYGDISRFLQLFPGVVASSDMSNQMLVRGGHPMENLFLVDGIEVPNINHLANANTTGGFGPMIDAAAIQGISLYTGGFDAKFPERLSSITELTTLNSELGKRHVEFDFGIQGIGGLAEGRLRGGDLLVSAHHGLINLVSSNVGINGVPSYTNELTRYRKRKSSGDLFTILNVAGVDSIAIEPCASDQAETSTINSQYKGWRETTGAEWEHVYSHRSFGVLNFSDSEQIEHINQQDQILNPLKAIPGKHACPIPSSQTQSTPVYREDSNNAFSSAKYRFEWVGAGIAITAGSSAWIQRPSFDVNQPTGYFSPYSASFARTDSASFDKDLRTTEIGTYAQAVIHPLKSLALSGGGRLQSFATGSHMTVTPRVSAGYRIGESAGVHVAYASYAQLPPYAYLLAYPVNMSMSPMRATHEIVGMDLSISARAQLRLELYRKTYRDIPSSTEYPSVTLHTMVDMLGDQFVWLPMNSKGRGRASGVELSDLTRIGSRLRIQTSLAYSRAKFAGTDGVFRPSNFDFPWIINAVGTERFGHGWSSSMRFGYATGRPYTPFDMSESLAQNRPVYDLSKLNVPRAPDYSRLDSLLTKDIRFHNQHLELYGGVDNLLNRSNFLSYAWMPIYELHNPKRNPVGTLWQTPIFPNFGVRLIVK